MQYRKRPFQEFCVLDAVQMLDDAWGKVKAETIRNCFTKAEISKKKQADSLVDADDPSRISRTS